MQKTLTATGSPRVRSVWNIRCSSPEGNVHEWHITPSFLFSGTTFACYDSYGIDNTTTSPVEAFLGRPYSVVRMGSDDGITSGRKASDYSDKYPSRRTSTSQCIRRQAED